MVSIVSFPLTQSPSSHGCRTDPGEDRQAVPHLHHRVAAGGRPAGHGGQHQPQRDREQPQTAVPRLEEVSIPEIWFDDKMLIVGCVLTADFGHNDLSGVEANILASGVTNVHTVKGRRLPTLTRLMELLYTAA